MLRTELVAPDDHPVVPPETETRLKVFAHVAYGFGAERWNSRWKNGALIGVNEPYSYGYHRAEEFGCKVSYSIDHLEGSVGKALRYAMRAICGFDFIHAWRNRHSIFAADAVWTHTESQSLAIAALMRFRPSHQRPKTILQSIWLIDRWDQINVVHRTLYRKLLTIADVLTFHSPCNVEKAQRVFPYNRVEKVHFGINADDMIRQQRSAAHNPIRVLAVGNDQHRDWVTLREALAGHEGFELRIVTAKLPLDYLTGNSRVVRVATNEELFALYRWADIAVVPLKPNLHASGITAVQEAVTQGIPVVCTDTGGLTDYFTNDEVRYVPIGNAGEMREAIKDIADNVNERSVMVERAQLKMKEGNLNARSFAKRHAEITLQF